MKNRRALSSVVGTVFAIIALGTTIGYITYSMSILEKFNEDTLVRNIQAVDTNQEDFDVVKASISINKFNITVQNSGNIPINITRLWIKNSTATNWVYKYDLNTQVSPGGTTKNIGQSLALTALGTKSYDVKLITQRGNTKEFLINSPYSAPLQLQLYAIPDTLPGEFTTTLILAVTNNMSSKNTILNITPITNLEEVSGNAIATKNSGPTPSSYDSLASGDTAYFKYVYEMNGAGGETKLFRASLQNGYPNNFAEANVVIQDVTFSLQSGSALESQGLSTSVVPQSVLVFHQETQDAADGRQMYSGAAETPTVLDTSQTQTFIFYTRNDTLADVDVDPGKWNATLRMISKPVPDFNPALASPKLIYLFEELASATTAKDSSGNTRDMTLGTSTSKPTADVAYGMNGTVGYHFDGGDYMEGPTISSPYDDIAGQPDTTTGWFKTPFSASNTKQIIFRVGSGSSEYYEITVADGTSGSAGKIFFKYSTTSTSSPQGTCSSSGRYDDGNWHHFAAVRDGDYTCVLYIDGSKVGEDIITTCSGCTGTGILLVEPAGKAIIGSNTTKNGNFFTGDLDQIFHWNDAKLTLHQVQALKNANYGANAHKFDFKLERTDSTGLVVFQTLKTPPDVAYSIPFFDGKGSTANSAYSTNQRNYTTGSLGSFKFTATGAGHDVLYGDRLKLTITRNAATSLNMTIKIDEPAMTNPVSSFLQTPHTDEPWPAYYVYSRSTLPQVQVYNQGPYASWITYLTRLTWDDIASTDSYASYVDTACGTSMAGTSENIRQDSPLIKVGQQCLIKFTHPRTPPNAADNSGTIIPNGLYRVNVFMSGYDDAGRIFLRTTYIGIIRVVP